MAQTRGRKTSQKKAGRPKKRGAGAKKHSISRKSGKSQLRSAAEEVTAKLADAGYEAFFAGGCVRDMLMRIEPKDYDIATNATPQTVQSLFGKTYEVGAQFGVVVVLHRGHQFEVATFREDSEYSDGRHPDAVKFGDAQADVMRRDFTINGMLYDPGKRKVIDYVNGQKDLKAKVVRCIGEPRERLSEDKLRMLRAVRFATRLGFEIEPATQSAVRELAAQVLVVSQERIRTELEQTLTSNAPGRGVAALLELGLLRQVLPELDAMASERMATETLLEHAICVLEALNRQDFDLALAALLHCTGGPDEEAGIQESARLASVAARRLKCSNAERSCIAWLVLNQNALADPADRSLSYLKRLFAHPECGKLMALFEAKARVGCASKRDYDYVKRLRSKLGPEEIKPEPLLTGTDLIEMGLKPSELFSVVLDRVYDAQLDGELQDRQAAIDLALKIARES